MDRNCEVLKSFFHNFFSASLKILNTWNLHGNAFDVYVFNVFVLKDFHGFNATEFFNTILLNTL